MCARIRRGSEHPQGAKYLIKKDGQRFDLRFSTINKVSVGDTIERPLQNGDHVVINRQPTLHKMSMMAHRVVVMKGKTFRLNLSVTTPYNADFGTFLF